MPRGRAGVRSLPIIHRGETMRGSYPYITGIRERTVDSPAAATAALSVGWKADRSGAPWAVATAVPWAVATAVSWGSPWVVGSADRKDSWVAMSVAHWAVVTVDERVRSMAAP